MIYFPVLAYVLLSLFSLGALAQIDSSQGSYSCYPCEFQKCGFENGGSELLINPSDRFGHVASREFEPMTCRDIQLKADKRQMDPEECAYYRQMTGSSSNPCECQARHRAFESATTGAVCRDPNQAGSCELCGNGKIIGDPDKHLPSPYYATCKGFDDEQLSNMSDGQGGFSDNYCKKLQQQFTQNDRCKCVTPGTQVTQCVPQLDLDNQCDPSSNQGDDQCCIGKCEWLETYRSFLCTTMPGDVPPPSKSPTNAPFSMVWNPLDWSQLTQSPTFQPSPRPSAEPALYQAPPIPRCVTDDDCNNGNICQETIPFGNRCIGRGGRNKRSSLSSNSGGASGNLKGSHSNSYQKHRNGSD